MNQSPFSSPNLWNSLQKILERFFLNYNNYFLNKYLEINTKFKSIDLNYKEKLNFFIKQLINKTTPFLKQKFRGK